MISIIRKIQFNIDQFKKNKFVRLARIDKPVGIYLSLFPALWAVAFASKNLYSLLFYSFIMTLGSITARASGCIINDILDRNIDKMVTRTMSRPIASGEVTVRQALYALLIYGLISIAILLTLTKLAILCGLIAIPLILIYPLLKRFTYYPQILLGFVFNIGALIGWFAVDPNFSYSAITLYISCIFWTIGFDTIYGHQDRVDDISNQNKSLSIKMGGETSNFVWALYKLMLVFLAITGLSINMNIMFYIVSSIAAYYLYWQAAAVDINNPDDCAEKFKSNVHIGLIMWFAILIGKF